MTHRRFFVEQVDPAGKQALLTDQTAHHAKNVLRLKPGDSVEVLDGLGNGWSGVIDEMSEKGVRVRLMASLHPAAESFLEVTLGMALARGDRMDLVVRQATEIGVTRFMVFPATRSSYGLSTPQQGRRRDRWLKIAREAMCQCGRMFSPEVHVCGDFSGFLRQSGRLLNEESQVLRIFASENESRGNILSVWQACPIYRQVLAVVGPEGGWTAAEVEAFLSSGFQPVRLGPRILRFETAATVLLTSVQTLWGDFGQTV